MYDQEKILDILTLHHAGASSRTIAREVKASKSGINYLIKREKDLYLKSKAPRIMFLDIETAPSVVAAFQRWGVNIPHSHVIQEGGWLLSASWKYKDDPTIYNVKASHTDALYANDLPILLEVYNAINNADIIVAYNGKKFDFPVIKTRGLVNKLSPHKIVRYYDPYETIKRLRFNSNKMQSVSDYLKLQESKIDTNINLWLECLKGNTDSLKYMAEYNDQDVVLLEQVYYATLAYSVNHPNLNIYYDDAKLRCCVCASLDVEDTGDLAYSNSASYKQYSCKSCGHRMRSKQNLTDKTVRSKILLTA